MARIPSLKPLVRPLVAAMAMSVLAAPLVYSPVAVAGGSRDILIADQFNDRVLIVTPEHDRSIPAVLKNAIDWGARPWGKSSWTGKPAFITGTSPGAIGSALAQQHLRSVMTGLGMILLGGEAYVTFKPNLIDEHGAIGDDTTNKFLQDFVDRFAHLVARLAPVAAERSAA